MLTFDTGLTDSYNTPIWEGDILQSRFDFLVLVCKNDAGYYGRLICPIGHSCENAPYHLGNGKDYNIVHKNQRTDFFR